MAGGFGHDVGAQALIHLLRVRHRLDAGGVHGLHLPDEVEDARELTEHRGRFFAIDLDAGELAAPEVAPLSMMRKTIARRLKEAQNTAAMLTTFNEVDMGQVMALRQQHKDAFEKAHGVKLGFMSFFAKAVVAMSLGSLGATLSLAGLVNKRVNAIREMVSRHRS